MAFRIGTPLKAPDDLSLEEALEGPSGRLRGPWPCPGRVLGRFALIAL